MKLTHETKINVLYLKLVEILCDMLNHHFWTHDFKWSQKANEYLRTKNEKIECANHSCNMEKKSTIIIKTEQGLKHSISLLDW